MAGPRPATLRAHLRDHAHAAQLGWIGLLVADTSIGVMFSVAAVLVTIELVGPAVAERRFGGTPWHPHHIAERYGLLTIITLGEVILGTVAALDAVLRADGWSAETALVGLAGVGLAFGMWWMYFVIPYGELLHRFRHRSFGWGYGHLPLFASLAGTGVGLHVAALSIEHEAHISTGRGGSRPRCPSPCSSSACTPSTP